MQIETETSLHRVNQNMFQHENHDISEMYEYFCTTFCSFF